MAAPEKSSIRSRWFEPALPRLLAHRGLALDAPENTLLAFVKALAAGATYLETDVHASKDGVAVLSHDPSLVRTAGHRARVNELTLAQLRQIDLGEGQTFSTLSELLAAFRRHGSISTSSRSMPLGRPRRRSSPRGRPSACSSPRSTRSDARRPFGCCRGSRVPRAGRDHRGRARRDAPHLGPGEVRLPSCDSRAGAGARGGHPHRHPRGHLPLSRRGARGSTSGRSTMSRP
ncbi:MAG: glycerophosphodiester phosphodiesterase family protein [Galbitalea sp.]